MKKAWGFLKSILGEIIIIMIFIFVINNYIGNVKKTINADGIGYYDYLPSIFIYHDLVRKDYPFYKDSTLYSRVSAFGGYVDYNGYKVNKYPCGTAILQLPFFTWAYLTADLEGNNHDGFQLPFQRSVFYAAVFYLFLALFFLKKILELYGIRKIYIIVCQLLLAIATPVTHYANYDASFSHIYSLFAITAFIYFVRLYFINKKINDFLVAGVFFGLILLLRQINIIIIFFVPFLAGSWGNLKEGIVMLFRRPARLALAFIMVAGMFFIQSMLWYLQTGSFLLYSYPNEGFNFLNPQIANILFSYRKGLFVYTPVLFLASAAIIWLAITKKYFLLITWLAFFLFLTYVLSSWWVWHYSDSYGMRAYIDFFSIFFILLAIMLNEIPMAFKVLFISLSLMAIPVNIIQTYQYKKFILHWMNMDKEKYWKVFLKTEPRYEGIFWKKTADPRRYEMVKEVTIGQVNIPADTYRVIDKVSSKEIPDFEHVSLIQVLIDDEFTEENDSRINLLINTAADNRNIYYGWKYLIHFAGGEYGQWQSGFYDFMFQPLGTEEKTIILETNTDLEISLDNVRLRFYKSK